MGNSGPSASGDVVVDVPPGLSSSFDKYSFSANVRGGDRTVGWFEVTRELANGGGKIRERGQVLCLTVEPDGKTARLGGVIRRSQDGHRDQYTIWTVRDNGEGEKDPPDQATDMRNDFTDPVIPEAHCAIGFPPEAFGTFGDIKRGNVEVKP